MRQIDKELFEAVEKNDTLAVKELLGQGASANVKNVDDDYPLYVSLSKDKNADISLALIEAMEPKSIQDFDSHPLRITQDIKIIEKLCDKGADINKSWAMAWADRPEVIQHLINLGGDVNHDLTDKKAGFLSNVRGNNLQIVKVFVENGARINEAGAIEWALSSDHRDIADYLLEQTKGQVSNVNECAIYSAAYGHVDLLEKFHKQGAEINKNDNEILQSASTRNDYAVAEYVLNNTDVPDKDKEKCLKSAVDNPAIVSLFLIDQKLKPTAETKEFMKENAPKDVQAILAKVELYEKLNTNLNSKPMKAIPNPTKKKAQGMKI